MTDCRLCPAGTVVLRLGVSGGGRRRGPRSRTGIQRASDAARRSLVLKNGISRDDGPVCVLGAVVLPGHPGPSGISGDGTGRLVHRTGVPIPFPSGLTWGSRGTGPVLGRCQRRKNRRGRAQLTSASSERRPLEVRGFTPSSGEPTTPRPVGQSGPARCWRYTARRAARPCLAVLGQLVEAERAERVRGLCVRRSYGTDCRAGSRNHRKGQVADEQITAALLVADPALTAAELAAGMADEVRRLGALRYDDGSGVSAPKRSGPRLIGVLS
jgi:hypothetical protein